MRARGAGINARVQSQRQPSGSASRQAHPRRQRCREGDQPPGAQPEGDENRLGHPGDGVDSRHRQPGGSERREDRQRPLKAQRQALTQQKPHAQEHKEMGGGQKRVQEAADNFSRPFDGGVRFRVCRHEQETALPPPAAKGHGDDLANAVRSRLDVVEEEREAEAGDHAAARPHDDRSPRPPREQPERDAAQVQQPGGDDKANRVGHGVRRVRQFRAVRVPVEDGEEADHQTRDPERGTQGEGDRQPEHDRGKRDAGFHARQRHAEHAQRAAESHHHRKDDRQQPHGGSTQVRSPQADGHHRRDMVQSGERMQEPADKTADGAGLRVRVSNRRNQHQQHHQ